MHQVYTGPVRRPVGSRPKPDLFPGRLLPDRVMCSPAEKAILESRKFYGKSTHRFIYRTSGRC